MNGRSTLDGSDGQRHTGRLGNVAIEPSLIGHAIIELHYRCGGGWAHENGPSTPLRTAYIQIRLDWRRRVLPSGMLLLTEPQHPVGGVQRVFKA